MPYQSKFFTTEQMSGSGQLNLVDLIERTQETIKTKQNGTKKSKRSKNNLRTQKDI